MNTKHVAHQLKIKQWAALIQEIRSIGIKTINWCKENNISKDTYYYWFGLVIKAACAAHSELTFNSLFCSNPCREYRQPAIGSRNIKYPDISWWSTSTVDHGISADMLRMVLQVLAHV